MGRKRTMIHGVLAAAVALGLVACSSDEDSSTSSLAPDTPSETTPVATSAPPSTSTTSPPTTTSAVSTPREILCDADSGEIQTFDVPLGTEVVLVAISTTEREYHLHEYDIELTGTEVRFAFTATIPGEIELTEHPGHSTVCTLTS